MSDWNPKKDIFENAIELRNLAFEIDEQVAWDLLNISQNIRFALFAEYPLKHD